MKSWLGKRYDGALSDLLIEKNIDALVKVNTERPLYASFFSPHSNINEFSPLMEGTDIYLLSASRTRIDEIKPVGYSFQPIWIMKQRKT